MKKVKFIVLVGGFMMASYHIHASEGAGEVRVDSERAKALGKRLIEVAHSSLKSDTR